MREIKFRTWVKNESKMISGYSATVIDVFTQSFAYRSKEVELMQYTGLKDKNGKEIFEGDVIRIVEDNRMGGIYLGTIRYLGNWGVYGFNMLDAKVIETRDFGEKTMGFLMKHFGNCFTLAEAFKHGDESDFKVEVIGNIYENPELLMKD